MLQSIGLHLSVRLILKRGIGQCFINTTQTTLECKLLSLMMLRGAFLSPVDRQWT